MFMGKVSSPSKAFPGAMTAFASMAMLLAGSAHAHDTIYYYSSDSVHSEVVITDANRNVVERTYYAPYGQVLNRSLRDGPGYTGHEEDPETSLVYMQQRYYDPQAGRFLSADPVTPTDAGGGFNRYWYAKDNPYRYTDPFGLYECGSKVSSGDCGKIDSFVNKINQALKGLTAGSNDFKALSAVSKFLGTKNDGNGVTIETASLGKGIVAQPGGLKTIELDMKKIAGPLANDIKSMNPGMNGKDAGVLAGGATVAHETQHLIDANQSIFDAGTMRMVPQGFPSGHDPIYEMATEKRAYGVEGAFGRGLGVDVGSSTQAEINANALASCQAQGSCP